MKAGDTAKVIGIPADAHDDEELKTRSLFEKCLGQSFVISAVETFDGVPFLLARIDVGHVIGKESWEHTIWVEREFGIGKPLNRNLSAIAPTSPCLVARCLRGEQPPARHRSVSSKLP